MWRMILARLIAGVHVKAAVTGYCPKLVAVSYGRRYERPT
jgi:hypothetical protein